MDPHLLSAMVHDAGELRKDADLSQRKLAEEVGLYYYSTTITQIEAGKLRVQPDRYEAFAKALGGLLTRMSSSSSSRATTTRPRTRRCSTTFSLAKRPNRPNKRSRPSRR